MLMSLMLMMRSGRHGELQAGVAGGLKKLRMANTVQLLMFSLMVMPGGRCGVRQYAHHPKQERTERCW